jgi:hypothetical protein
MLRLPLGRYAVARRLQSKRETFPNPRSFGRKLHSRRQCEQSLVGKLCR